MYSYNPDSFVDSDVCDRCTVLAALEARLFELEASIASGAFSPYYANGRLGTAKSLSVADGGRPWLP